jgi:hypothetical protein
MRSTVKTLVLASAIAIGATAAFAQSYPTPRYDNDAARYDSATAPLYAAPIYSDPGEQRDTAYGQGGTAGTHPTGANVGPGRAEMIHGN